MVKYYSDYKKYLDLPNDTSKNQNIEEAKQLFLSNFDDALVTEIISVDEGEFEVMLKHEKKGENKKVIFKPNTRIDIGSVIKFKENVFLAIDFLGDGIYEVYPTATLKICNSTFPIESDKTEVLIGYDDYGRPEYDYQILTKDEPCIVETKYYFNNRNEQITLPEDRVMISMKYQKATNIATNKEFDLYESRFRITFIDYSQVINGKGIMTITGERVMNK